MITSDFTYVPDIIGVIGVIDVIGVFDVIDVIEFLKCLTKWYLLILPT